MGVGGISMESGCQKLGKRSRKALLSMEMGVTLVFSLGPHKVNGPKAICSEGESKREQHFHQDWLTPEVRDLHPII